MLRAIILFTDYSQMVQNIRLIFQILHGPRCILFRRMINQDIEFQSKNSRRKIQNGTSSSTIPLIESYVKTWCGVIRTEAFRGRERRIVQVYAGLTVIIRRFAATERKNEA